MSSLASIDLGWLLDGDRLRCVSCTARHSEGPGAAGLPASGDVHRRWNASMVASYHPSFHREPSRALAQLKRAAMAPSINCTLSPCLGRIPGGTAPSPTPTRHTGHRGNLHRGACRGLGGCLRSGQCTSICSAKTAGGKRTILDAKVRALETRRTCKPSSIMVSVTC